MIEGQRLLAKRRGPIRRWMVNHPLGVNIILVVLNGLIMLGNVLATIAIYEAPSGLTEEQTNLIEQAAGVPFFAANVVGLIAVSTAIFYRDRWPLILLLATGTIDALTDLSTLGDTFTGIVAWYFLFTLASRRPLKPVLWGFCLYLLISVGSIVITYLFPTPARQLLDDLQESAADVAAATPTPDVFAVLWGIVFLALVNTVVFMLGRSVYRSRMFEQAILKSLAQNKQLATTEERNRIAREMHDVVSHSLTVMIALSDGARIVLKKKPERAEEVLAELSQTGRTALADMRRTLGVLRDPQATDAPLTPTGSGDAVENLNELVQSFASTGLPVSFTASGDDVPNDHNLRLSLYRITQEALTNVLRYGHGVRTVDVSLKVAGADLYLTIINDGDRFESENQPSMGSGKGLVGMAERAAFYQGTVDAGPNDRGGWTVRAHLTYPATYNKSTTSERTA